MRIMENHVHRIPEKKPERKPCTRAEYLREWRKKNPEKNALYCQQYWQRRAEEAAQREKVKP